MKKPTYEDLRHDLDTKMMRASSLPTQPEQQTFVNQTFVNLHKQYAEKQISHGDYVKLINRLAAFKGGQFNDHIDTLAGAAQLGMLDMVLNSNIETFSPEQSRLRRDAVTDLTGVQPVEPDADQP